MSGPEATFKQHFSEFTDYLKPVAIVSLVAFTAAFYLSPHLINYAREVTAVELIAIHPYEILATRIKIGFYTGLLAAFPVAALQMYRFFKPALTRTEQRIILTSIPLIFVLTALGGFSGFIFLSELTSEFLAGLATGTGVANTWSISNVISYMLKLSLATAFIFNIPIITVAAVKTGMIDVPKLKAYRNQVIVGSVAFAAVISPPDFLSMIILSLPTYLSYEVGIKAAAVL